MECNGCHTRTVTAGQTAQVHGRRGLYDAAYAGGSAGVFPGTIDTIFADPGDTMAQARARPTSSCPADPMNPSGTERCGRNYITPSANVIYDEVWKVGALPTESFAFTYQNLTTAMPVNPSCFPVWQTTCRITIHYASIGTRAGHIHPLWSVPRPLGGIDTNGDMVPEFPQTCTLCHNRIAEDGTTPQVPAASLELTDEVSDEDAVQLRAYRHLLFDRPELEIVDGAVVPRTIPGPPDADGNPTTITPQLPPSMAAGNARGSRFFAVMNNNTHAGMLSPAELRLLSEWLDIGAQYYNDPFPPTPQN
jgi:hypothetical protein